MKIPLVGTPGAPEAQRTFAPLSVTTYDQVGQAGARLGSAVEGVAEDLPVRIKGALDAATLAKTETLQETHFQAFTDSLRDGKNPENNDPATYLDRWKAAQTDFKDQVASDSAVKGLGLTAKIQYQASMAKWQATTNQAVGHIATQKALENAVGDIRTGYEMNLMDGSPAAQDKARGLVETGMKTGLVNPEEGKQMIFQIPMKAEYNQAVKMMGRDPDTGGGPIVLEKALKEQNEDGSYKFYPHVVGQQRESLTFDAYRNARFLQASTAADYAAQAATGQQPDPNQVQKDLQLGKINPAQAKALLKPQRVFTPENFALGVTVISDYDPKTDPTHEKEAQIWASLNEAQPFLSPEANQRLNSLFKDKLKDEHPLNSEVAKGGNAIIAENFRLGVFGKYENKVEDKEGNVVTTVNQGVLDKAQQGRAAVQSALNTWLSRPENEKATPAEVQQFISDTVRPWRKAALWAPAINPASGKAHP